MRTTALKIRACRIPSATLSRFRAWEDRLTFWTWPYIHRHSQQSSTMLLACNTEGGLLHHLPTSSSPLHSTPPVQTKFRQLESFNTSFNQKLTTPLESITIYSTAPAPELSLIHSNVQSLCTTYSSSQRILASTPQVQQSREPYISELLALGSPQETPFSIYPELMRLSTERLIPWSCNLEWS